MDSYSMLDIMICNIFSFILCEDDHIFSHLGYFHLWKGEGAKTIWKNFHLKILWIFYTTPLIQ